jgi:hypothetical protein
MLIFVKNDFLSPRLRKLLGTATETKNSAAGMCGSKEQKRKRKKMIRGGGKKRGRRKRRGEREGFREKRTSKWTPCALGGRE